MITDNNKSTIRKKTEKQFSDEHKDVISSLRISRIVLPIIIGIAVVGYLFYKQFDPEEFRRIDWSAHTLTWIGISLGFLCLRHMAYAWRLRILSDKEFSWLKCIQLVFIWEFSSAISPTAVGGSAVAFFVLSQEKLSTAKTATIVLYTVVLDSLFFLLTVPLILFFFGTEIIRPDMNRIQDLDGWGFTFFGAYLFMLVYCCLFAYGLFISPEKIKRFLLFFTKIPFFKKFRKTVVKLGNEMILSSKDVKSRPVPYHLKSFMATAVAWSSRFLLLNCLIIAIVDTTPLDLTTQGTLFGRLLSMFVIIAFSPTPGGAGFVEILFGGFLKDFVPKGIAVVVASIWRIFTYYSYLLAGAIIIPQWLNTILRKRAEARKLKDKEESEAVELE